MKLLGINSDIVSFEQLKVSPWENGEIVVKQILTTSSNKRPFRK